MADDSTPTVRDMHFRVMFRKHGMSKVDQWNYTAPDPDALMKMLDRTEDINTETCDLLVVHGYLPNNAGTIEVICHDNRIETNPPDKKVVPITYKPIPSVRQAKKHRQGDDKSEQDKVIEETERILREVREGKVTENPGAVTCNPPDVNPKGVCVRAGFGIVAYPAQKIKGEQ